MTEHPILFSGPMVQAILDGHKMMTRRVVKFPYAPKMVGSAYNLGHQSAFPASKGGWIFYTCPAEFVTIRMQEGEGLLCPYGQPGDRLWVREAWRVGAWAEDDGKIAVDYKAGPICRTKWLTVPDPDKFNDLWEGSTQEAEVAYGIKERYKWKPGESPCRWRPSLFMPRWASRITLEITAVRVERVQDISEEDVEAEGLALQSWAGEDLEGWPKTAGFAQLWDSLNAKRGYGWEANPWVWVIAFKRVK